MASVHPTDGYHFDPATASGLESALHQAAADARTASSAFAATIEAGVTGYGDKVGPEYRNRVADPARQAHLTICDGLELFARQIQQWTATTTAADQATASDFAGGGPGGGQPAAQVGPIQSA